jgi:hypothetical protein
VLDYLSRKAKPISVVAGFLFGVVGSFWSFVVVDRLGEEMRQLSDLKADMRRQIESLNRMASDYFIANQQGDLIFMLTRQGSARQDVAGLVYKGNILDRAEPVRNMIGALAIAKQLDCRKTYDAYEKLNDETRANLTLDNFTKLKQAEKDIIGIGEKRVEFLQNNVLPVDKAINANEAAQKKSRVLGLIASTLGSLILLCANLIASNRAEEK